MWEGKNSGRDCTGACRCLKRTDTEEFYIPLRAATTCPALQIWSSFSRFFATLYQISNKRGVPSHGQNFTFPGPYQAHAFTVEPIGPNRKFDQTTLLYGARTSVPRPNKYQASVTVLTYESGLSFCTTKGSLS